MTDSPVVLNTGWFPNRYVQWQQETIIVNSGVDLFTGETVVMPELTLAEYVRAGAVYDKCIGEYILW